jgi:hypothetical protein
MQMLNHPTIDQLKALKLDGMVEAFVELAAQDAADDMSHAEWLGLLIDREAANRTTCLPSATLRLSVITIFETRGTQPCRGSGSSGQLI